MSKYHIETTKTLTENGITYNAHVNKFIDIDFSATEYKVKFNSDGTCIDLSPLNMDILHEITELFPLSQYDIKLVQHLYRHIKSHVSIYLDITNKVTHNRVFFAESAVLSDKDYEYFRDILNKEAPDCKWQSVENYIRSGIEGCLRDDSGDGFFTDDAFHFLSRMVSSRYKEIKTEGLVDFDYDKVKEIAKDILEEALRNVYDEK